MVGIGPAPPPQPQAGVNTVVPMHLQRWGPSGAWPRGARRYGTSPDTSGPAPERPLLEVSGILNRPRFKALWAASSSKRLG